MNRPKSDANLQIEPHRMTGNTDLHAESLRYLAKGEALGGESITEQRAVGHAKMPILKAHFPHPQIPTSAICISINYGML